MTHLCYTLEEAAEKLKLTETVLVRLSQFFKVPQFAYEESGYLSFKGDLAFTDQDIAFFRQVRERLLLGESLDEVRGRIRQPLAAAEPPLSQSKPADNMEFSRHLNAPGAAPPAESKGSAMTPMPLGQPTSERAVSVPLKEIQDNEPYEKAVAQSFERYKSVHRTGLGRVFENMLKEIGTTRQEKAPERPSEFRPMKGKKPTSTPATNLERLLPFQRDNEVNGFAQDMPGPTAKRTEPLKGDPSWEQLLKQAVDQPRSMNSRLKGAAALLRERAMGHSSGSGSASL